MCTKSSFKTSFCIFIDKKMFLILQVLSIASDRLIASVPQIHPTVADIVIMPQNSTVQLSVEHVRTLNTLYLLYIAQVYTCLNDIEYIIYPFFGPGPLFFTQVEQYSEWFPQTFKSN